MVLSKSKKLKNNLFLIVNKLIILDKKKFWL